MVDALRRARRWVAGGRVIDLRPADVVATVIVDLPDGSHRELGDLVVDAARRKRYAAADAAVRTVVGEGVFTSDAEETFSFYSYADTADELRDHIATWRETRLHPDTHAAAAGLLTAHPGARLRLKERVILRTLK
ncbi:MAG TPA: hypothetical protein VEU08_20270 [Vicinamibacterales bacterium]|nr:hypothetical protein [Vicinamibacterales bacterium]